MGADIVGWIGCPLQSELDEEGFLWKLKLAAMRRSVEEQVPASQRAGVKVKLTGTNRQWGHLTYNEILLELKGFEEGIPECASCSISRGRQLGCYSYISYPIDATFERLAFEFFSSQLPLVDSASEQIFRDVVSRCPSSGTPWHTERGPGATLAELPEPLTFEWTGPLGHERVDSAQMLSSLFISLHGKEVVLGYSLFWLELSKFFQECNPPATRSISEVLEAMPLYLYMVPMAQEYGGTIIVHS